MSPWHGTTCPYIPVAAEDSHRTYSSPECPVQGLCSHACTRLFVYKFACAGSSSAQVREQAARAISALVQGQALLAVQGSQAKPYILLSACREAEACTSEENTPSPWDWDLDLPQKPVGSLPSPHMSGLELLPDLAGLQALAEQLIFQATGQEHAEVSLPHRRSARCGSLIHADRLNSRVV